MRVSDNTIQKYQAGGYMEYQPLPLVPQQQQPQQAGPDPSSGKEKAVEGLDPDILKKMVGEGITTDTMQYSQMVNQAYQQYQYLPDAMKNSYRGRQLRNIMRGDLGQLNALARGKKMLDTSIETAKGNGALDEVAVTQDGMMVKDGETGKVAHMTYAQFVKQRADNPNIHALTNAELADEREYNPQLMGNSSVFGVLNYGKGIEKVKDEIFKIVSTIGTSSRSNSTGAYGDGLDNGGSADMQILEQAAANGAFKIKDGSTVTTNAPQIEKAKLTMWANLSDSAKSVLRARAATEVQNPGQIDAYARQLAASLLDPHESDIRREVHDETYKKLQGGGAGGKATQSPVGLAESAFMGLTDASSVGINTPNGAKITTSGYTLPPSLYTGKDGKRTTLQDSPELAKVGNLGEAFTVNGDKVRLPNTVITGDARIAWLPVIQQADGTMKVDQEGAKNVAEAEKEIAALPANQRGEKRNEIQAKYGVNHLNLQRVIVAEATSYSEHPSWWDGRDSNYYSHTDEATEKYVGQIVDPNKESVRHSFARPDNSINNHLVIIPAKSQANFRDADGGSGYLPQSVFSYDPHNPSPYNSGGLGVNISQGRQYSQPAPSGFSKDYFTK